jgi:hypothetical protein
MNDRLQKIFSRVLWALTIAVLVVVLAQGFSGNWITIFLVCRGDTPGMTPPFLQAMGVLARYHGLMGIAMGSISILAIVFSFLSKSGILVKLFSIAGLLLVASAAMGGILYEESGLQDNWPLGQMMDSFIGAVVAYSAQLFFMGWKRLK